MDEERKHVLDLARLTGSTPDTISKVLDAQIALLMLDMGLRGRAQTVVGEVKRDGKSIVLVNPNRQLKRYTEERGITEKLLDDVRG
jgi:hypothetical protein